MCQCVVGIDGAGKPALVKTLFGEEVICEDPMHHRPLLQNTHYIVYLNTIPHGIVCVVLNDTCREFFAVLLSSFSILSSHLSFSSPLLSFPLLLGQKQGHQIVRMGSFGLLRNTLMKPALLFTFSIKSKSISVCCTVQACNKPQPYCIKLSPDELTLPPRPLIFASHLLQPLLTMVELKTQPNT